MKYLFTICLLGCMYLGYSQNIMFFSFNDKYEKVTKELKSLPCDTLFQTDKTAPLTAFYDGFTAKYYFNTENRLYKIDVFKNYASVKDSREAVEGALVYFDKIKAYMTSSTKTKYKKYKAHKKDNLYEMEVTTYADNDVEVRLGGWNKSLSPGEQYEPDYETMRISRREKEPEDTEDTNLNVTAK
ncbi:MAG: hypothetical protein K1X92_01280 [Bacteroidia bacterium]|nr:hypothetical protein [Bacteroidia bacterium]